MLRGPGLIARKNPGVFNLYWLMAGLPHPGHPQFLEQHRQHAPLLHDLGRLGHCTVQGIPINEWAVTHKPQEFSTWISSNHAHIKNFPALRGIPNAQLFSDKLQKAVATLA